MNKEGLSNMPLRRWTIISISAAAVTALAIMLTGCSSKKSAAHAEHVMGTNETDHAEPVSRDEHGAHNEYGQQSASNSSSAAISFSYSTGSPKAGETTRIELEITDADGKPIESFDINHEKKLHLIAVSHDLSYFNHIHPEYEGAGKFAAETSFPSGGAYKLYADFIPTGQGSTTLSAQVEVEGAAKKEVKPAPDSELVQTMNGNKATLALSSSKAGEETELSFDFTDEATGKPITDLEPYLGAVGHVVIVSADLEHYLHVHPMEEKGSGPSARFMTTFPTAGVYKIWGQFQRDGQSFVVPFVVAVS